MTRAGSLSGCWRVWALRYTVIMMRLHRLSYHDRIARMRGQALLLGLLLLIAAGLVWAALYDVGQTVAARTRLTHAADAVAYSGALLQARALNMHALINRTQVAHQVAMGHLAALASWAQFGDAQGRQATRGNPPASLITLFGTQYSEAYRAARSVQGVQALADEGGALTQAYAEHDRTVHEVLAAASVALLASWPNVRSAGMREVLAANFRTPQEAGASAEAVLARAGVTWSATGGDALVAMQPSGPDSELRAVLDGAVGQYGFLAARNHTVVSAGGGIDVCPALRPELRRRGQTTLDEEGVWQSADTQSFQALRANQWIGCYYREYPMGWGLQYAAHKPAPDGYEHVVVTPPDDFSGQAFWRWVQEHTDWDLLDGSRNALADSHAVAGAVRWPGRGLPDYAALDAADPSRQVLTVTLRQRLAPQVRILPGWFADDRDAAVPTVTVASAAQTYFARPEPRADGQAELANLFHPYWQARLAALP